MFVRCLQDEKAARAAIGAAKIPELSYGRSHWYLGAYTQRVAAYSAFAPSLQNVAYLSRILPNVGSLLVPIEPIPPSLAPRHWNYLEMESCDTCSLLVWWNNQ